MAWTMLLGVPCLTLSMRQGSPPVRAAEKNNLSSPGLRHKNPGAAGPDFQRTPNACVSLGVLFRRLKGPPPKNLSAIFGPRRTFSRV
jgi:hypothetical protein